MSIEAAVRAKQAMENNVKGYLKVAAMLTTNELEIGLARIADSMQGTQDSLEHEHFRFRGQVLKAYFDLRTQNKCIQNIIRRKTSWKKYAIPEYSHPLMLEHREKCEEIEAAHTKTLSQKKFWQRIFSGPAKMPWAPVISQSERLIQSVTVYRLFPQGIETPNAWNPTAEELLLLEKDNS